MRPAPHAHLLATVLSAGLLAGCGIADPYQTTGPRSPGPSTARSTNATGSPGEAPAPPPPTPASQTPVRLQPTPQAAIAQFARLYTNWTWRTLTARQRELASISIGAARLAETQAAATSRADTTITRAHIHNHGQLISVAPSATSPAQWVIVTRERTGGDSQYDGLQAAYHVTLAELTKLPGGYAISSWMPRS